VEVGHNADTSGNISICDLDTVSGGFDTVATSGDFLPTGLENPGLAYDPVSDRVVAWDLGRLGGNDDRWFYLVVELDEDLKSGSVLVNRLEIAQVPEEDTDPVPGNNTYDYTVRLEGMQVYLPLA